MKDENCIFCKLANGDIPTATVYEDEDFRVILDANPAAKGPRTDPAKRSIMPICMRLMMNLQESTMILAKK